MWNVDADGVPHDLGVLSHYAAVVWYLGDNRLTMDPEDALTSWLGQNFPDLSVAERQQYLTIAVRDFLNEGGKLVYAGETAGYFGLGAALLGGIYYGLDGAPEEDCVVLPGGDPFADCLLLADDFTQYYLGVDARSPVSASGIVGSTGPFTGIAAAFGGPATVDNPLDEAGAFVPLNDVLPPEQFPWFGETIPVADYVDLAGPFLPVEGAHGRARRPRGRQLHASRPHVRSHRRGGDRSADGSRRCCRGTPSSATTTSSSRRTPSVRRTGRRCPTSTATRRPTCPPSARPGSCWPSTRT